MTISVKCKKCKQGYKLGDDKAGLRLKCKQCGASIRVPQADDFDDVFADDPLGLGDIEYEAPATAALPSSVSRPKSAGKSPVALIATLVGVFAFFGGSIAGYSLKALLSIPQTPVSSPQTAANDEGIAEADKAPSSGMTPPPKAGGGGDPVAKFKALLLDNSRNKKFDTGDTDNFGFRGAMVVANTVTYDVTKTESLVAPYEAVITVGIMSDFTMSEMNKLFPKDAEQFRKTGKMPVPFGKYYRGFFEYKGGEWIFTGGYSKPNISDFPWSKVGDKPEVSDWVTTRIGQVVRIPKR